MEKAIKSVIKDALSKLITDSEFFTLVIRIKFTMKKDMVNEGNKILTGSFHKKKKKSNCTIMAEMIKNLLDTYVFPLNFICGNSLNKT